MVMNVLRRDRKPASTPDADMEDDQNGYCVLFQDLLTCFILCYCPCVYEYISKVFLLYRSDGDDQHAKMKCFR